MIEQRDRQEDEENESLTDSTEDQRSLKTYKRITKEIAKDRSFISPKAQRINESQALNDTMREETNWQTH